MKYLYSKLILVGFFVGLLGLSASAQCLILDEEFTTSLGTFTSSNNAGGASWVFTNSCTYSSSTGHSAPGSAIFKGSSCQFAGSSTVSGDLTSPSVFVPASGGDLTFNYYLYNECGNYGGTCYYDRLSLQISNNGGTSYTTIADSYTNYGNGQMVNGGWSSFTYDLASYAGQTIYVRFNFNSIDGAINNYDGVYVDDVKITALCPFDDDAGIANIISPSLPTCDLDSTDITVAVQNLGSDTLFSCSIKWQINGGSITTYSFSGAVPPLGGIDTVTIANVSFTNFDDLHVWTENPNGQPDSIPQNDEDSMIVASGLAGTYGIPSDFATLTAATAALNTFGVCDDVIMSIATGPYNEQIQLGSILGVNQNATVTWKSASGNASDVYIHYATTGSVVSLSSSEYISFEDVTIRNTDNSSTAGATVNLSNTDHVTFDGCRLIGSKYQGYNYYARVINAEGGSSNNLTLTGNEILNGSYAGIWLYGNSADYHENVVIENNVIKNCYYYYPTYMYYCSGVEFNNNVVTADTNVYPYNYGVYLYYSDDFNIKNNYIGSEGEYFSNPVGFQYGLYVYQCIGYSNPRTQISNNCINSGTDGTAYAYAYYASYLGYSGFIDFHNNSINRRNGYNNYVDYSALTVYQGGLISIKNNSLANYPGGTSTAMYINGQFAISESDYNNFYNPGSTLIYSGNQSFSTTEAYYAALGYEEHSVSTDPLWIDPLTCVTCNDTLNNAGTPDASVSDDISGNPRSLVNPDIGAVEWVSPSAFSLGGDSTYCEDEVIIEAGPAQSVNWSVNGNSYSTPSITLTAGTEATTYNVLVNIQTAYCGSGSDNALITLVPNAMLDSNTHLCANQSATLNPGGLASGTYSWSNGATTQSINVSAPGVYTVTKNVLGCESQASTIVTKSQAVEIIGTEVCSDDLPLELDATIQNGTSYAWSGGATPGAALNSFTDGGPYTVTVTDAYGCTSIDSFEIVVLEEPEAVIDYQGGGGTILIFNAYNSNYLTSNSIVNWNFGTGATPATSTNLIEAVTYPWSNPSSPASYSVSLEINNGCGVDIASMVIQIDPLGVDELEQGSFAVYPNPANDVVSIVCNSLDVTSVEFIDVSGRILLSKGFDAGLTTQDVNVSELAPGAYLVRMHSEHSVKTQQLIVQ